jgi:hypothetical protein
LSHQNKTAMANFEHSVALTTELLKEHGLYEQGWRVIPTRAKHTMGVCKHRRKQIGLSTQVIPFVTDDSAWNTITHEVAHAIVGKGHGHDYIWRNKHRELGGDAKRTYDHTAYHDHKEPEHLKRNEKTAPYYGECPSGHKHYKHRQPTRETSCGVCSRSFDKRYLIKWTKDGNPVEIVPKPRRVKRYRRYF